MTGIYRVITHVLAVLFVPVAWVVARGRALHVACQWALNTRYPAENLSGLTPGAHAAFTAARTKALWRHGILLGLTSGHRDAETQAELFDAEVQRTGSYERALRLALPPAQSQHVQGVALDVRPYEGAQWLEVHGARYGLYRVYDNEWWHFEYHPDGPPQRLPHPGFAATRAAS
ncbi:D-alanyl-D-alanine carboxypeptidase family protein [Amycolatopsis benzoatilytica]|uniref:D-alanyl-D-alanine carboxypeptidase family protein n=1 Tax=Amycolatopsis benzoatilytica TaxID=346045 RepID=UPI000485F906|nr:D-alanyl-D-alanine carboxypeptidase family protein [Amycolatopsis benzoatilytica]